MLLSEKFPEKFPYFVQACVHELQNIVVAPEEDLVAIIDTFFEEFEYELTEYDYNETTDNRYMDTLPREILYEAFGKYLIGMSWPCYGNTREYKTTFNVNFEEAVMAQGWQIAR